jgi:hypothetical protein
MILDPKGRPLLGHVQAGLGLIGYLSQEGSSFSAELAKSIDQVESYCTKKGIPITDLGYTGELDFIVKELGVVKSRWSDPGSGTVYVLCWYSLSLAKGLPKIALDKIEEMTVIQNPSAGANPSVFEGKTSRQIIDAVALDCRSEMDAFSHMEAKSLLECMAGVGNYSVDSQQFVTTTQVEMLQLNGEESRIFRRYCSSFRWNTQVVLSNDEMDVVGELARRTAEEQGSLTVTTYSFESVHGGFLIISHRTQLIQDNYDRTIFYSPYSVRDRTYPGLPTKKVIEVL